MRYLRRLLIWIDQNLPAQCPTCQQWQAKKNDALCPPPQRRLD